MKKSVLFVVLLGLSAFAGAADDVPVVKSADVLLEEYRVLKVRVATMAGMIGDLEEAIVEEDDQIADRKKDLKSKYDGETFSKTKIRAEIQAIKKLEERLERVKEVQRARKAVYAEAKAELDALKLVVDLRLKAESAGNVGEVAE